MSAAPVVVDLGRLDYARALEAQQGHAAEVLAARDAGAPEVGRLLLVEHDPVITVTRKAERAGHLLASPDTLDRLGVRVEPTDRGGDITYHGPGQLVVYPILDLNELRLGLHDYMRLLEGAVIAACARFGVTGHRDPSATGVWVGAAAPGGSPGAPGPDAKLCAFGVRVRRWVSLHGLALNVEPNLDHFRLIVPCGLAGRPVTSLRALLGDACPTMEHVKGVLVEELTRAIAAARDAAVRSRRPAAETTTPRA